MNDAFSSGLPPFASLPQLIEVTGGKELTIISTAESAVTSNVRFQVMDSTKLVLDVPDLTITSTLDWVSRSRQSFAAHHPGAERLGAESKRGM